MRYHLTINLHGDTPKTLGIDANRIAQRVRELKLEIYRSSLFNSRNYSEDASKVSANCELVVETMMALSDIETEFTKIAEAAATIVNFSDKLTA